MRPTEEQVREQLHAENPLDLHEYVWMHSSIDFEWLDEDEECTYWDVHVVIPVSIRKGGSSE